MFLQYVQCRVCPPDNVNVLEWDKKRRAVLRHISLVFLERDDDRSCCQRYSRNHASLPIRLVLVAAVQNPCCPIHLEDHSGVLLHFRRLAEFGGWSDFRTYSCQLTEPSAHGNMKIVSFFRHKNFLCCKSFYTYFGCVVLLQCIHVCCEYVSFPASPSPAVKSRARKNAREDFLTELMEHRLLFRSGGMIFNSFSKWYDRSCEMFAESALVRRFHQPINPECCAESNNIPLHRPTTAHPILTAQEP